MYIYIHIYIYVYILFIYSNTYILYHNMYQKGTILYHITICSIMLYMYHIDMYYKKGTSSI